MVKSIKTFGLGFPDSYVSHFISCLTSLITIIWFLFTNSLSVLQRCVLNFNRDGIICCIKLKQLECFGKTNFLNKIITERKDKFDLVWIIKYLTFKIEKGLSNVHTTQYQLLQHLFGDPILVAVP